MAITGKDDLQDTAGVLLTSHTPSGTGATGGPWVASISSGYGDPVAVSGGYQLGNGSTGEAHLSNSFGTGDCTVEAVCNFPNDSAYAGVALVASAAGAAGVNYQFFRSPGAWTVQKNGGLTALGTVIHAFATGTPYTLKLRREISGSNAVITAYIDGVQAGQFTDSTSPLLSGLAGGILLYGAGGATVSDLVSTGTLAGPPDPTVDADDAGFVYYGRWGGASPRVTITIGAECQFAYTGDSCILCFDTSTVTGGNYPIIHYWIDNVGPQNTQLDADGVITVTPANNGNAAGRHIVRFMANVWLDESTNWASQTDAVKFLGVALAAGKVLLPIPENPNQIEFLGDSITAASRLLYTGTDGVAMTAPQLNWTEYVSQMLGLKPVVNGHGGQSLVGGSIDGAPAANAAFPYSYAGAAYSPAHDPVAVVIYQGTNGSASQAQWTTFLATVRAAYPDAAIFAINPYRMSNYAEISAAVTAAADARLFALDYSGAFATSDTSDGTHFNPSGAAAMASRLSSDIQSRFATLGLAMQTASGGGGTTGSVHIRVNPFTGRLQYARGYSPSIL